MSTCHYVIVTGAGARAPRKDACFVGRIYECQNINDLEVEINYSTIVKFDCEN